MNWLHYLMEANLYLAVFYTVYYVFLSNDTHYTLNRAYLLLSCIVSFIIPVIQLGFLKPAPQAAIIQYVNYHGVMVKPIEVTLIPPPEKFNWQDGIFYIYLAGAAVLLLVLICKLYQLMRIIRKSNKPANASYKLIALNDSNTAFSFFNFLFIGTKAEGRETIIKHELVHISQKHSADIVFIELLKIINWFNPFIYILQHSLKAIHEYIADEQTASTTETDALTYSSFLVHNAYGLSGSSITHSFFNYNLLKKRIIMLNQKRSGSLARLKYLLAVPICGGLLCASTLAFSKNYGWVDLAPSHTQATANAIKADLDAKGVDANPQAEGYTNKGYKYKLNKYIVGNGVNFLVIIYEKNGSKLRYAKSAATPADIKLLSEKYGFTFPSNGKYKLLAPDTIKFMAPVVKKDTLKTINHKSPPPPPPSAVKHITDVRLLPPPPASPKVIDVKLSPPVASADTLKHPRLPPPPPINPAFVDLYTDMAKKIHYPAKAFENQIAGNVIVKLYLNSDHKISDVKIVQGSGNGFDEEVVRVLKSYPLAITDDSGSHPYYIIGVSFNLVGDKSDLRAPDFGPDVTNTPNYACVVQVNGYIK